MSLSPSADTLLSRDAPPRTRVTGLPPALLAQSARRLRILALQYAFVFFMSDPLMAILFPEDRAVFLASALRWAPATLSITAALLVAALTLTRRIEVSTVLSMGLVFEVVGSFGIAAAQSGQLIRPRARYTGPAPQGGSPTQSFTGRRDRSPW